MTGLLPDKHCFVLQSITLTKMTKHKTVALFLKNDTTVCSTTTQMGPVHHNHHLSSTYTKKYVNSMREFFKIIQYPSQNHEEEFFDTTVVNDWNNLSE